MSCSICTETFTSAVRKRTDCSYCNVPICRTCLQTCLLMDNAAEPVCPSCRAGWSREFLNNNLTAAFRNGPFKKYREKVLLDRERARLPETQAQAAAYKAAKDMLTPIDAEIAKIRTQAAELPTKTALVKASEAYNAARKGKTYTEWSKDPASNTLWYALHGARDAHTVANRPLSKQIKTLNKGTRPHRQVRAQYGLVPARYAGAGVPAGVPAVVETKHVFIQKCPAATCEGFLSTQWICGLCELKVCKDCHEPKTDTHICDPEVVASIKAIKKEAKPCPKCASQISKIDGCDQMWCTQCKTAFSWQTGKIETHVVHNPHYFQWMRANGGVPRQPGDAPPNPCAGRAVMETRLFELRASATTGVRSTIDTLLQYLQTMRHLRYELTRYQHTVADYEHDEWRRRLRVQRMVQEITEVQWKTILQRKEKEMLKDRERLQLLQMYTAAGMDILGQVMTDAPVEDTVKQLTALYTFTDASAQKMADVYKCKKQSLDMPPERTYRY